MTPRMHVRELARALYWTWLPVLSGDDHLQITTPWGITWFAVVREDAEDDRIWDVFPESDAPKYGEYAAQVADRLLTTSDAAAKLRETVA